MSLLFRAIGIELELLSLWYHVETGLESALLFLTYKSTGDSSHDKKKLRKSDQFLCS